MLKIEGKTFMNIQEAVQWLLDNNALPFQSSANYQANTEIGLGTIVNPSPAKVRIGSLIFFADSKVSTVVGITETGFICSNKYNSLVDDIAYVANVSINASGHLITTLSDGQTIDAGIVKQVSGFSINASQHLVVTFNDGTTNDLGAIFSGNVNIAGTLNALAVTGDSIIENMGSAYGYNNAELDPSVTLSYVGVVKNGNKITFVWAGKIRNATQYSTNLGRISFPSSIGSALYPDGLGFLDEKSVYMVKNAYDKGDTLACAIDKLSNNEQIRAFIRGATALDADTDYYFRIESTFLLSPNLAS